MTNIFNLPIKPTLPAGYEQTLRQQVIDENGPGTILRDFETILKRTGVTGLQISGKQHLLVMATLADLNAQMAHPIQLNLKRPQQKSYPHLNGLYLLLRATGLTYVDSTGSKQFLRLDEEIYSTWAGLNPTERYFTLLDTWLIRASPDIIGERADAWNSDPLLNWSHFFPRIPDQGWQIAGNSEAINTLRYTPQLFNLALLELFGFIIVRPGLPKPEAGWQIDQIKRTPLGDAMLQLLLRHRFNSLEARLHYGAASKIPFGEWQSAIQPYFPAWRRNLALPQVQFQDGLYIFKVSLGWVWRRIAIPATSTLDELSNIILKAYEFDYDHLYAFAYTNRFGAAEEALHPYMDDGPWATEIRIGDLPLKSCMTMGYLYDFGDNWQFQIRLERIDSPDAKIKQPTILEKQGQAPEQYPSWD